MSLVKMQGSEESVTLPCPRNRVKQEVHGYLEIFMKSCLSQSQGWSLKLLTMFELSQQTLSILNYQFYYLYKWVNVTYFMIQIYKQRGFFTPSISPSPFLSLPFLSITNGVFFLILFHNHKFNTPIGKYIKAWQAKVKKKRRRRRKLKSYYSSEYRKKSRNQIAEC